MGTTQYDNIVTAYNNLYDNLQDLPFAQLEEANLHAAVKEHVQGKCVLELGCGSGHYSRRLLEWGAGSVFGVDISPRMVEEAEARAAELNRNKKRLSYHVGDVSAALDLSPYGGPFDLVVGTWLLNYASCTKEMEGMWRTVATNLRFGFDGLFIGITIPPPLGNQVELNRALANEMARYGTSGRVQRPVPDGFEVLTVLGLPKTSNSVEFENYYLRPNVFSQSAKSAGMNGALEWLPLVLPPSLKENREPDFWNGAILNPHFRICQVRR